ncbi:AbrB family transcriptional regulator [Salipaludibacillus keqinensis]|uniref:AbrB family transcriptional regulator n=1 Tax=Salipaludibacillus keqinensis TaxID=2045207 RepID=UPI001304A378|nr:AbrB family transcriptional regulator [Salipaludibacillus keqinensis]
MIRAGTIVIIALAVGWIFNLLQVPAGWLLGALLTGLFVGLTRSNVNYDGWPFKLALSLVGANIGLLMNKELFGIIGLYLGPLLITLLLTLISGFFLGWLLFHWSKILDKRTAFFCCIPGGASEIISVSSEYGADERIVAAFHTARITLFVLCIPFVAGIWNNTNGNELTEVASYSLSYELILTFIVVMTLATVLNRLFKVPAGALLYAIAMGFIFGEFVFQIERVPNYIGGIGQGLIGVMVGVRFDRETLVRLKRIGTVSISILSIYLGISFISGYVFWKLSDVTYIVGLLSVVPAGAAEMSATAFALELEPTLVASLQIIRVISIFVTLPLLIWLINKLR